MRISRRDTIIIAVLVNTGLLAILLMTAIRTEDEVVVKPAGIEAEIPVAINSTKELMTENAKSPSAKVPVDTVDDALGLYSGNARETHVEEIILDRVEQPLVTATVPKTTPQANTAKEFIDVVVKKGDVLEKIARTNGASVEEIKRVNNLTNDKLTVGQKLRIPVINTKKAGSVVNNQPSLPHATYYVVQSGDNPWKIARQFKMKYEDILLLNDLNEEKARNLQPGDKIRVK